MRRLFLALPLVVGSLALIFNTEVQGAGSKGGNNSRPVQKKTDIDITTADDVKVRTMTPPTGEFDEKGNVKKPSNSELRKMKGDTPEEQRLPGYKIELSGLHNGDIVKVSIGKAKEAPKSATTKNDDKPAKTYYTPMGEIVGTVKKVSGSHVTIEITSTSMQSGRNYNQNNNKATNQTLDEKLLATMIIVEQAAPDKGNNNNNNKKKGDN